MIECPKICNWYLLNDSRHILRGALKHKFIKFSLVASLGISTALFLGIMAAQQRGPLKEPTKLDGDIKVVIQTSGKEKSTEIYLGRSFLGLNERLYQRNNTVIITSALSVYLLLPDLTPATEFYDKPISSSQMAQNEIILAEGNLVEVELEQGIRTPTSYSALAKSLSWVKGSDSDSIPGFELFHISSYIKSGIQESHVALVPTDPEYRDRVYLECPINNHNTEKRQLCRCHTGFANQLYGSFSFSKSKFDEWKALHKKLSAWVESKIAK